MKSSRPKFILTCSVAALLTASTNAFATDNDMWQGTDGNYNEAANWSLRIVPGDPSDGNGSNVKIGNYGPLPSIPTITTNIAFVPQDVRLGEYGSVGRLDITAGSLTISSWTYLGIAGGTGTLNVADTTTTSTTNFTGYGTGSGSYSAFRIYIGSDSNGNDGGTGTVNVNTTGSINVANDLYVGTEGGSNGTLNMDAGTLNRTGGWCFVGGGYNNSPGGQGVINQSGGIINQLGDTFFGVGNGSVGTLNITGGQFNATPDGGNNNNGAIHVGSNVATNSGGVGVFNLSGSALVTTATNFVIGDGGGTTGTVTVGGNATLNTLNGDLYVGNGGSQNNNTLTVNGGTVSVANWLCVGRNASVGTLNMEGGTLTKVNDGNGFFDVGASSDSSNNGTVNLDGGVLTVPKVITEGGTSTFNFNGGTLQADGNDTRTFDNNNNTTFMQDLTTANVRNGGAIIDTNGFGITIPQPLVHSTISGDSQTDGGLTVQSTAAGGVLNLTGTSTYTGVTNVNSGTLLVNGAIGAGNTAAGAVTVAAGATLGGTGSITTGLGSSITVNGTLAPGADALPGTTGALTLTTTVNSLTLASTAVTAFDITNASTKDLIASTGGLTSLHVNGTLALNLGSGFDYTQTYTLFTGFISEQGSFSQVTGVAAGETPVFSFVGGDYDVSFGTVPEPATWAAGVLCSASALAWLRRRRVA